jgi:hypothetical protein
MIELLFKLTIAMVLISGSAAQTIAASQLNTAVLKKGLLNTNAITNNDLLKPIDTITITNKDLLKPIDTITNKDLLKPIDTIDLIAKPFADAQLALKKNDFVSFVTYQNAYELKTWAAKLSPDLDYNDNAKLRSLLGAQLDNSDPNVATSVPADAARLLASYPLSYDLRSARPSCWSIGYIRHQAQCGSCWAVAGATSLSDRYCYKRPLFWFLVGIQQRRSFSYQDPLECCSLATCGTGPNKGCNGGKITGAFAFAQQTGIVTGENFGNNTNCKNYFLASYQAPAPAPSCRYYCPTAGYGVSYNNDKYKIANYKVYTKAALGVSGVITATMGAIYNRGTVVAYMDVYSDFFAYSTGVYSRLPSSSFRGGHAVRLIGWGANAIITIWVFKIPLGPYWIAANSWGTNWGINGFFYIKRGSNECNIEAYVIEGTL